MTATIEQTGAAVMIDDFRRYLESAGFRLTDRTSTCNHDYDLWRRGKMEVWLWHDATWDVNSRWTGPCTEFGLGVLQLVLNYGI